MHRVSAFLFMTTLLVASAVPAAGQSPTEELLAGMVTEEVEPGVFRVINDGVRDLALGGDTDIVAGHDDGIWLLSKDQFIRLASDAGHAWPNGVRPQSDYPRYDIFEVTPDGRVWVIQTERVWNPRGESSDVGMLFSSTGDGWDRVQTPGNDLAAIAVAPDGTLWATWSEWKPDGSESKFHVDPEVGHLGPSGWEPLGYRDLIVQRLYPTDSGVLYAADCYYGTCVAPRIGAEGEDAWSDIGDERGTFDVAPDGTVWFLETEEGEVHRYAGDEWASWTPEELPDMGLGIALEGYAPLSTTFVAAPDGSLWASLWQRGPDGDEPPAGGLRTFEQRLEGFADHGGSRYDAQCDGLVRFDGQTLDRFLPGQCIAMDIAADGSVWALADEKEGKDLYVITPEAVAASVEEPEQ